ncbi:MAG: UDP-glucose 4-epimerase GalE [Candidatus Methanomethylophilaceae archaeon]|nr:UDP-glucose 4-epimerase GalE [Candidatus Methanomethylophilaceae archaeon]
MEVSSCGKGPVLVTGGDGYIGSHCVVSLLDSGYDVVVFDNHSTGFRSTGEVLSRTVSRGKVLEIIEGDLLNPGDIDSVFEKYRIPAVLHFAAFSQVAESMADPGKYYMNNVSGTMNLLDSMRKHGVGAIVFSSTAATYGEPEYIPIDEKHPQNPINPYGRTKLDIEYMMDDYGKAYGLVSVRLRYFNVAGADSAGRIGECHDPETHLVPNILKSMFGDGTEFRMFGTDYPTRDGTCVRDYVNVEDLADAHVLALKYIENGGKTDFFNLGTQEGSTVKEVFAACEKVTGMKIPLKAEGRRPGDPAALIADSAKAKRILGWAPRRTLEDSIRTAYAWEKKKKAL